MRCSKHFLFVDVPEREEARRKRGKVGHQINNDNSDLIADDDRNQLSLFEDDHKFKEISDKLVEQLHFPSINATPDQELIDTIKDVHSQRDCNSLADQELIDTIKDVHSQRDCNVKTVVAMPRVYRFFSDIFGNLEKLDVQHDQYAPQLDHSQPVDISLNIEPRVREDLNWDDCLKVGDHIEIECDGQSWNGLDSPWIARVTEISKQHGFRFVWMYTADQTIVGEENEQLSSNLLFASSHCECKTGSKNINYMSFSHIICRVNVTYSNIPSTSTLKRQNSMYYVTHLYEWEHSSAFIDVPSLFKDLNAGPIDLCGCPNADSDDSVSLLVYEKFFEPFSDRCVLFQNGIKPGMFIAFPFSFGNFAYASTKLFAMWRVEGTDSIPGEKIAHGVSEMTPALRLRRLPHKRSVCGIFNGTTPAYCDILQNELLWSSEIWVFSYDDILSIDPEAIRIVNVQFLDHKYYKVIDPNQTPATQSVRWLKYRGAGDKFFFVDVYQESEFPFREPTQEERKMFLEIQPYESPVQQKLRCFDLMSGCGLGGRGLEDSGVCDLECALDIENQAIHSHLICHSHSSGNKSGTFLAGDASKILSQEVSRPGSTLLPEQGDIDLLLSGPPCQGYSNLNKSKHNERSQLNRSLTALSLSYAEFYNPCFTIMENVNNFVRFEQTADGVPILQTASTRQRTYNIFKRLIAYNISLGRQVRWTSMSAANHGVCQVRNRMVIITAQQGLPCPTFPKPTHLQYITPNHSTLSYSSTPHGKSIDLQRIVLQAPCDVVTVEDVIGHLPSTDGSMRFDFYPNHISRTLGPTYMDIVPLIPPNGSLADLSPALRARVELTPALARQPDKGWFPRIHSKQQLKTIPTTLTPTGWAGAALHYIDDRLLTIQEVGLAQGEFHECISLIQGTKESKYRQLGNGIPRTLGFAIGRELLKVLVRSSYFKLVERV
ncbi:S-adenosyl-L-methionine-dependent methyltransferase [Cladochytrium replicatum]|nr:S-adenosyl-L-methionine-dependent methyltransferase [Cladochytrium replicatum]